MIAAAFAAYFLYKLEIQRTDREEFDEELCRRVMIQSYTASWVDNDA